MKLECAECTRAPQELLEGVLEHLDMQQMCARVLFQMLTLSFSETAAVYPPTSGPSSNMYGNVPGYEGTTAGGGKVKAPHQLSCSGRVCNPQKPEARPCCPPGAAMAAQAEQTRGGGGLHQTHSLHHKWTSKGFNLCSEGLGPDHTH